MNSTSIRTPRLTIVLYEPEGVLAWVATLPQETQREFPEQWLQQIRAARPGDFWQLAFDVRLHDGHSVGGCTFKGPPDHEGVVELGYGIDETHRNRGYATEVVKAIVEFAAGKPGVRTVRAHTKLDNVASQRVLDKCGFVMLGKIEDLEDGTVRRWELDVRSHKSSQTA